MVLGVGLNDLYVSLPTRDILCLYDSVSYSSVSRQSFQEGKGDKNSWTTHGICWEGLGAAKEFPLEAMELPQQLREG